MKDLTLARFAGFISEELRERGIETILVGGACVTIFSDNRYQSYDLDFVVYTNHFKTQVLKWFVYIWRNEEG